MLTEAAEQLLAEEVERHRPVLEAHLAAGAYTDALSGLADLQEPVDRFFDEVMVMDEDAKVRNNRLNLLNALQQLFRQLDIQVGDRERVVLDKIPARFDLVSHQRGKDQVSGDRIVDGDFQQPA